MNQEQTSSMCASYYDFCSVGQRLQGNRQQFLTKQNSRLRKQHAQISQKYIKMCNQLSKMQSKFIEKQKKISQLDSFYRKQIQQLKKQLIIKNNQIAKFARSKQRKSYGTNKQNMNENHRNIENLQICIENQSQAYNQLQIQNNNLHKLLIQAIQIFQPFIKTKQNQQIQKRFNLIKNQLHKKSSIDLILQKSNSMLEETRAKTIDKNQNQQLGNIIKTLRNKNNQLKKIPLTFDYDLEIQSKNLQILLTDLEIQMRLLKQKKGKQ